MFILHLYSQFVAFLLVAYWDQFGRAVELDRGGLCAIVLVHRYSHAIFNLSCPPLSAANVSLDTPPQEFISAPDDMQHEHAHAMWNAE